MRRFRFEDLERGFHGNDLNINEWIALQGVLGGTH